MPRQSISLSEPNSQWLESQVESKEYASKSEAVNDLIRQARKEQEQLNWLRKKLEIVEKSGLSQFSAEAILEEAKSRING